MRSVSVSVLKARNGRPRRLCALGLDQPPYGNQVNNPRTGVARLVPMIAPRDALGRFVHPRAPRPPVPVLHHQHDLHGVSSLSSTEPRRQWAASVVEVGWTSFVCASGRSVAGDLHHERRWVVELWVPRHVRLLPATTRTAHVDAAGPERLESALSAHSVLPLARMRPSGTMPLTVAVAGSPLPTYRRAASRVCRR